MLLLAQDTRMHGPKNDIMNNIAEIDNNDDSNFKRDIAIFRQFAEKAPVPVGNASDARALNRPTAGAAVVASLALGEKETNMDSGVGVDGGSDGGSRFTNATGREKFETYGDEATHRL